MTGRPPRRLLPDRPLLDGPTVLRPWRDDDLQQLVLACQDPEISRWTSVPRPYSEADARAYLRQRHEAAASGSTAPMAIANLSDGRLLGSIALARFHWYHRRAEVGYWLAREARGKGHATRAVRLICAWGLGSLALERIELLAATGNLASQRVAERAGFTREAVLRSHLRGRDGFQDMVVFGLLPAELAP